MSDLRADTLTPTDHTTSPRIRRHTVCVSRIFRCGVIFFATHPSSWSFFATPPTLMFLLPRTFYMVFHVVFTPPPPSSATPQCSEVLRRNEIFHRWGEFYIFAFFSRANFPNEDDDDANDDEDVLLWKNVAICCLLQRGCHHRRFFVPNAMYHRRTVSSK